MGWNELLNVTRTSSLSGVPSSGSTQTESDTRSQFQRDYDRTLFSTPVRRLQDKAQVFPLEPNDSVRTRLTHSLEVSNVAQGIARQEWPDLSAYADPEVVWRMEKRHHAGLIVRAASPERVEALLGAYARRFAEDFTASLPAPDQISA